MSAHVFACRPNVSLVAPGADAEYVSMGGPGDDGPTATFHALVHRFQQAPVCCSAMLSRRGAVDGLQAMFFEACGHGGDGVLVPLRPQQAGGVLQYLLVTDEMGENGSFPSLVDPSWFGLPPFMALTGPSVSKVEIRDLMARDWPDSANIYVLGAHTLSEADGELFVHSGMTLVLRPPGSPPAFVNYESKITDAFTTPMPRFACPASGAEGVPGFVACLGYDRADVVFRCDSGRMRLLHEEVAQHADLPATEFRLVTASRPLVDFHCRGFRIDTCVGVQLRREERKLGLFVDARDLGFCVRFVLLAGSDTTLTELLDVADVGRPPDVSLVVYGAVSFVPSSERLLVGQRSVITISRARGRDPAHTTLVGRDAGPAPDPSEGDDGSDYSERPEPASGAGRSAGHRPCAARATSSVGRSSGRDSDVTSASHHVMWMPVSRHDALLECQQADTPAVVGKIPSPSPGSSLPRVADTSDDHPGCSHVHYSVLDGTLPTLLEMSDPGLRICWLDKVWMALVKGLGGFFDEESSPRDKPAVISLAAHLPLASSCPSQQFDMDHSQCVLPIAEDMLLDFWRFVPFHKLLRPPRRPDTSRSIPAVDWWGLFWSFSLAF